MKLSLIEIGEYDKVINYHSAQYVGQKFTGNYNESLNLGAKRASGDYLAFCNDDIITTSGWFDKLLPHFDKYDSLSPHCPDNPFWKEKPTGIVEGYEIGKILCGWCIVMHRKTYEKIGGFDECVQFWYSDNIYADQLKYHGLRHALVTDSIVYHEGSKTLHKLSDSERKRLTTDQRELYLKAKEKYLNPCEDCGKLTDEDLCFNCERKLI